MTKTKKKKRVPFWIILVFIVGLGILFYPLITRIYNSYIGNDEIISFQSAVKELSDTEILEQLQTAYAYNSALLSNTTRSVSDPYSDEAKDEGVAAYADMIEVNEKLGVVNIPKLSLSLPIYAGTNESVLQKGVGHLEGTSLPIGGLNSHSVITAHRGLAENKLFTDLDKMEVGDLFYVESLAGNLAYEVIDIQVIEPTDFSALAIQEDQDLLTLLTCTPYMINSHRLLVIGERTEVPTTDVDNEDNSPAVIPRWQQLLNLLGDYIWILLAIFALVLVLIIRRIYIYIISRREKNQANLDERGSSE